MSKKGKPSKAKHSIIKFGSNKSKQHDFGKKVKKGRVIFGLH